MYRCFKYTTSERQIPWGLVNDQEDRVDGGSLLSVLLSSSLHSISMVCCGLHVEIQHLLFILSPLIVLLCLFCHWVMSMMVSYVWSGNTLQVFYSLIFNEIACVSYRIRSLKLIWNCCLITEIFSLWFTHTRRWISDESAILVVFSVVIPCEDSVARFKASNHLISVPKLGQRFWTQLARAWGCWKSLKALIDAWSACY